MFEDDLPKKKVRKPRPPKPVTEARLREQALRYLDRFAATNDKIRRHLITKNRIAIEHHQQDMEEIDLMISQLIEKLEKIGILDDQRYADSKARSLSRQGKSIRQIKGKLNELGLGGEFADHAMEELQEGEGYSDRIGAAKYIRKRRFGPFKDEETREQRKEKELMALVRNGYSFRLAEEVLTLETKEEIEDIIYGTDETN